MRTGDDLLLLNKGIVRIISSDPKCKDGNARFTTVPLKSEQEQIRY